MRTTQAINRALSLLGIRISRINKELPDITHSDSTKAVYDLAHNVDCTLTVQLSKCVMINGLSFAPNHFHPFVAYLNEYIYDGKREYTGSVLEQYYSKWAPKNALQALLPSYEGNSILESRPAYAFTLPWWVESVEEIARQRRQSSSRGNTSCPSGERSVDKAGSQFHGPVAQCKGQTECDRLVQAYESIKERGYDDRTYGVMLGELVVDNGDQRLVVYDGNHRLAALTALGYEEARFRLKHGLRVRTDDVHAWHGVRSGLWAPETAVSFHNGLFSGRLNQYIRDLMDERRHLL